MKRLWPALREYRGRTELLLEIIGLRGGLWLAKRKCFPWASGAVIETRAGWRKRDRQETIAAAGQCPVPSWARVFPAETEIHRASRALA